AARSCSAASRRWRCRRCAAGPARRRAWAAVTAWIREFMHPWCEPAAHTRDAWFPGVAAIMNTPYAGRQAALPALVLTTALVLMAACAPAAPPAGTRTDPPAASSGAPAASGGKSRVVLAVGSETVSASPYGDSSPWVYAEWMHVMEPLVFYN